MHRIREGNIYAFYFVPKKGNKPPSYDDPSYNHIVNVYLVRYIVNMKKSSFVKLANEYVYTSNV